MLYRAILLSTFGASSDRPKRMTIFKLTALTLLAALGGHVLALGLGGLPDLPSPGGIVIFLLGACMMQVAVLVTLLLGAGPKKALYGDSLARLLLVLPLGGLQRWLALLLPAIILALLAALLVGESLVRLLMLFAIHPVILPAAFVVGAVSAMGLVYGLPRLHIGLRVAGIGLVLWLEAMQLGHLLDAYLISASPGPGWLWSLALVLAATGMLLLVTFRSLLSGLATPQKLAVVKSGSWPAWLWMAKKIMRSPFMFTNLALNVLLSSIVAWFVLRSPASAASSLELLSFIAAFMAAITVSDIRGLSRRVNPAEIVALRGTSYFVRHNYWWGGVLGFVSVLPLAFPLVAEGATLSQISFFALRTLFGLAVGLLVGMMLTPAPRDVSGQFAASVLCIACVIGLPQLWPVLRGESVPALAGFVAISVLLLMIGRVIEYKRNNYLWENTDAQK